MDAGLTGALIGIGVMGTCAFLALCESKIKPRIQRCIQRSKEAKQQTQSLLPVVRSNPVVVFQRSQSKVKNLFPGK